MDQVNVNNIPLAPAPWTLKGKAWVIPYSAPHKKLPVDAYPLHERGTSYTDEAVLGAFRGKTGSIQIIRYEDSGVGPYDEIIFLPGYFDSPVTDKPHPRITTIYVSSEASIKNGRINWAIPKYLARFCFTPVPSSPSSTLVTVSLPSSPDKPFFSAVLTPARFLPSIPVPPTVLALITPAVVQPPLAASPLDPLLVGCPDWMSIPLRIPGRARIHWAQPALPLEGDEDAKPSGKDKKRWGDGVSFADCEPRGWALGLVFTGIFPVPTVLTEEPRKLR